MRARSDIGGVTTLPPLSVADWQALAHRDPDAAGREVHRREATLLSPAQQRECLAAVVDEVALAGAFVEIWFLPHLLFESFDLLLIEPGLYPGHLALIDAQVGVDGRALQEMVELIVKEQAIAVRAAAARRRLV